MTDKTFVQLVGNAGKDDPIDTNGGKITSFSLAVPTGYGDDQKPAWYTINAWLNDRDQRGDFRQWIKDNIRGGSKGIFVEGFLTEKPGRKEGQVFRDVSVSRIGLVEYAERRALAAVGASEDEF